MADFSSSVAASTQEADPGEAQRFQNLMQKRAEAAAKQFGQATGGVPAPTASLGDTLKAERQATIGEFDRRKAAAEGKYSLAQQTGQAAGGISDRVREALYGRQQAANEIAEQQRQQGLTAGQTERQANQQFGQKLSEVSFSKFKTDAERADAMTMAYKRGQLEKDMLLLSREGGLKMADIDRAFQIKYAEIENAFKDWEQKTKLDNEAAVNKLISDAKNTAAMISGITTAATAGVEYAAGKGAFDTSGSVSDSGKVDVGDPSHEVRMTEGGGMGELTPLSSMAPSPSQSYYTDGLQDTEGLS